MDETNGWVEWRRHVLKELERLNGCYEEQQKLVMAIQMEVTMLKVKSTAWGGIAGLIPSLGILIWYIVKQSK